MRKRLGFAEFALPCSCAATLESPISRWASFGLYICLRRQGALDSRVLAPRFGIRNPKARKPEASTPKMPYLNKMSRELSLCNFKAVLFDVDGTLVDSMGKIVNGLGDAFEKFTGSRPDDAKIRSLIGLPLNVQLRNFGKPNANDEEMDEMIQYTISRYEEHRHLEQEIAPAIEALMLCHQAGIKTALVTSKNAAEMETFVQHFSGLEYVDVSVTASDVARPKPDPECVLRACDLLNVAPQDSLYIGDAIFDMQSARAAGSTPVAVAYGSASAFDLAGEMPAKLIETPEELLTWTRHSLLEPTCRERKQI
jgi:HAD superfamily hydrolase (TIGR01509 family)